MSWKKLILWLLALTLCLVGGLLIWAFHADLGRFQPQIEDFLTEQLDRETRFDDLSIDLGSSIEIRMSGFRIANVPGAEQPDFVSIPFLEGAVTLSSLFDGGPLIVERLQADGVRVNLAWDENGEGNFKLGKPQASPPPPKPPRIQPLLLLRQSHLDDAALRLTWPSNETLFEFATLEVADEAGDIVTLSFDGAINGHPMGFSGQAGPREGLLTAGAAIIEGQGNFASLFLNGKADFDNLARPDRPIVQLTIEGDDIREVEEFLGVEPGDPGAYQLLLDSGMDGNDWTVDLRGHIGEVVFDANGEANGMQDLSRVGVNVHAQGPDLGNVLRLFRIDDFRKEPFEVHGRVIRDGSTLQLQEIDMDLGSTRFDLNGTLSDFPHLRGASVQLEVRGEDIESFRDLFGLPGEAQGAFALDLTFEPGAGTGDVDGPFDRMTAQVDTNLGSISINGNISGDERYAGSTLVVDFDGNNAAASLGPLGLPGLEATPYNADARLQIRENGLFIESWRLTGLYATDVQARGLVGWEPLESDTSMDVTLEGQDLASALLPLGVEWPLASAPFKLTSGIRATPAGLRLDGLALAVEQTRLEADALVPLSEDLAGLDITLQAEGPELSNVFRAGDALDVPEGPWTLATHVRRVDSRLLMENTRISVADVELTGEGSLPWPVEQGSGSFKVQGQGTDVTTILPRLGDFALAPRAFTLAAEARIEQGVWRLNPSSVTLGAASLNLSGTAEQLPDSTDTDLDVELDVPSLAALGSWRGESLNDARFSLKTRLKASGDRATFDPLELRTGDSVATGSLLWDDSNEVPFLELNLASQRLDLREILPESEPMLAESLTLEPEQAPPSNERLIPDTPLPLDWLEVMNGAVDVRIEEVILHDRLLLGLKLNAGLQDGLLSIEPYRVKGRTGEFDVVATVRRRDDGKADVNVDFQAVDLLPAREDWQNADPATLPKINAMLDARAVGATPRELAASLNGRLRGVASEGTLPGNGLGALNSYFLEQIVRILVPGLDTQQPTVLKCFAGNVLVRDGVIKPEPLVTLRTDKLLVLAAGSVDLRDETLHLQFQTTPSKLLGASLMELANPFVSIEGTLASPRPILDPGRTIVYGGAAAATGGLSIVAKGLWDRLRGAQKPCEQLRTALEEEAEGELRAN